jgi:hypothetical protein
MFGVQFGKRSENVDGFSMVCHYVKQGKIIECPFRKLSFLLAI